MEHNPLMFDHKPEDISHEVDDNPIENPILPSGYLTVCHGKSPCLRTVNHLFRLGPSIPWQNVSHNQRVSPLGHILAFSGKTLEGEIFGDAFRIRDP